MTGFGRGRANAGFLEVVAEVRSVNHRFMDISLRLPRVYSAFEPKVRKIVAERVNRGKIDVSITRSGALGSVMDVEVDHDLARRYHRCLSDLKEELGLDGEITLSDMLTLKEIVLPVENEEEIEKEFPVVVDCLEAALKAMDEMRSAEGATVWRDIEARLLSLEEVSARIEPLVAQVPAAAKERLEKRVRELTGGMDLDQDRLLQEVVLIVDRADVTEELTRLGSHIEQFLAFGQEGSPLGRKLDFLLQELHREVNTIGSKSASTEISSHVVLMKTELEKIREQIQNLE
jgi:uncharacterized protein (TIGR00255 family)